MNYEKISPIDNYVGTQLKLDGYFNKDIVDVVRKDMANPKQVKELKSNVGNFVIDFLDSFFDEELPITSKMDYVENKLSRIKNNLKIFESRKGVVFTQFRAYCPNCSSKNVVEDGYYDKDMVLDYHGHVHCRIKRYECRSCGKGFSADISGVVNRNFSVSHRIIRIIWDYYAICGTTVRKIQEILKRTHNVVLSHQEIQDIIVDYIVKYKSDLKNYSGYYAFDSLWVKIDELSDKYVYFLALFDVQHRTLVDYKIVKHETSEEVYKFLREATHNQPRIAITSDLHPAYQKPIQDLGFKHQFCEFHTKQNINKYIYDYVKEHKIDKKTYKTYKKYLEEVYEIYEAENRFEVLSIIEKLNLKRDELPTVINEVVDKKIRPYSSYITQFIEDSCIVRTSNWIERIFGDLAPKHLKNNFKTLRGFLSRINLKLERWDRRNAIFW